jgi:hypothetical protein
VSRITNDADILEEYVADGTQDWEGGHVLVLGSQDGSASQVRSRKLERRLARATPRGPQHLADARRPI